MMMQLLQFGLLLLAIRKLWGESQLRMLAATVTRVLRRWTTRAILETHTVKTRSEQGKRPQLRVASLALKRKYWRAAKVASTGMTSALRLRRRQL